MKTWTNPLQAFQDLKIFFEIEIFQELAESKQATMIIVKIVKQILFIHADVAAYVAN